MNPTSNKPNVSRDIERALEAAAAKNDPPPNKLTPEQARDWLIEAQSAPVDKIDVDIQDLDVPAGSGESIPMRIVRPKGEGGPLPLIFYLHGGGWVMGNRTTHDRLIRELADGVGAAVAFPEYTPAPEGKYPLQLEETYAALQHILKHAEDFDIDREKVILAGDSAGGNMATVLSMLSKERNGAKILFQLMFYPVTDAGMDTDSYKDFENGPALSKAAMAWFWEAYLPGRGRGIRAQARRGGRQGRLHALLRRRARFCDEQRDGGRAAHTGRDLPRRCRDAQGAGEVAETQTLGLRPKPRKRAWPS